MYTYKDGLISRATLSKIDSIQLDPSGDYVVTGVSDDEASDSSHSDHDETYSNYCECDEIDETTESWD